MFKEKYYKMNGKISPSDELIQNTISNIDKEKAQNKKFVQSHRPILVLCVLLICIFTVIPVLAATVTEINELMYLVSPSVAQYFKPVQKSCVSNGIEMEVISAYIHGETAEIYITMQDLEGERIDETTDLNDSYDLRIPFDNMSHCESVGYDEKTKTATFLINITNWENKKIDGDKLTFSVNEFLSREKEYKDVLVMEDLTGVSDKTETQNVSMSGYSNVQSVSPNIGVCGYAGTDIEKFIPDDIESIKMLKPSKGMEFPIEGIKFTGIGYVDGMLHVQTSVKNSLKKANGGFFELWDKEGKVINSDYSVGFVEYEDSNNRIDYDEEVFNIPKSELNKYSLYGWFVTSGMYTEGKWKVTFALENSDDD